jgi:hypothetical protein
MPMRGKTGTYKFMASGAGMGKTFGSGTVVLLHPFKNLSAHEFSFPFQGMSKVRDALKIQFRPLLGEAVEKIGFIPFFAGVSKKTSSGCVFLSRGDELDLERAAAPANCIVWPAPLAFAGEVGPNGLIIWHDGANVTSVWLKDWIPVSYRTMPLDGASPEDEEARAVEYIVQAGGSIDKTLIVDASDVSERDLQACGMKTLAACPAYSQLDLSGKGTNLQEIYERKAAAILKCANAALVAGLVFLLAACGVYFMQSPLAASDGENAAALYETAFGEKSMQPLASAAQRLRAAREGKRHDTLASMLRDLSSLWERLGGEPGMAIETLRYGSDSTDMLGSAESNESIGRMRAILEELGYATRTDNIQAIPGGGMRFNMNVSKGGAR